MGEHMSITTHERLCHAESYSRTKTLENGTNVIQADMYLQEHLWKHVPKQPKSRSKGTVKSITR